MVTLAKQPYTTASPVLANYSYTDIASGTGYIVYNAFATETSAAVDYHLGTSTVLSNPKFTEKHWAANGLQLDLDFDLTEFQITQTLEGTALVSFALNIHDIGLGAVSTYAIAKVRKWDGSTETEIASVTSNTFSATAPTNTNETFLVPITIPQTVFAVGETLRLTIEVYGTGDGDSQFAIAHDPADRAITEFPSAEFTTLKFHAPSKLDL